MPQRSLQKVGDDTLTACREPKGRRNRVRTTKESCDRRRDALSTMSALTTPSVTAMNEAYRRSSNTCGILATLEHDDEEHLSVTTLNELRSKNHNILSTTDTADRIQEEDDDGLMDWVSCRVQPLKRQQAERSAGNKASSYSSRSTKVSNHSIQYDFEDDFSSVVAMANAMDLTESYVPCSFLSPNKGGLLQLGGDNGDGGGATQNPPTCFPDSSSRFDDDGTAPPGCHLSPLQVMSLTEGREVLIRSASLPSLSSIQGRNLLYVPAFNSTHRDDVEESRDYDINEDRAAKDFLSGLPQRRPTSGDIVRYWKQRLQRTIRSFSNSHPKTAEAWFNLGHAQLEAYRCRHNQDEKNERKNDDRGAHCHQLAVNHFTQAHRIWAHHYGPYHLTIGRVFDAIGLALVRRATKLKAEKCVSADSRRRQRTNHKNTLLQAQKLLDQAFAIRFHQLGVWHVDTVETYNKLAGVYLHLGQLEKALHAYQEVYLVRKAIFGSGDGGGSTSTSSNNKHSNVSSARSTNFATKTRATTMASMRHPSVAISAHSVANVYYKMKQFDKAIEWYQVGLVIYESMGLSYRHPTVARLLKDKSRIFPQYIKQDQGTCS